MANDPHNHDHGHGDEAQHKHGPACVHEHFGHGDDGGAFEPIGSEVSDASSQSLADALHMSFRLLSLIMLVVFVALLLTGLTQIHPGERGIKLLFGRIQGEGSQRVLGEGLHWSWPEPIGRVLKVGIGQHKLEVLDFWPENVDTNMEAAANVQDSNKLRPGYDHALFTGDRSLLHLRLACLYSVGGSQANLDAGDIVNFVSRISGDSKDKPVMREEDMVRAAVCSAAIRAAATRTVDYILTTGRQDFANAVMQMAQEQLSRPDDPTGIHIQAVLIDELSPPAYAISAFHDVNSARQTAESTINKARGDAVGILNRTAGENWKPLVGDLEETGSTGLLPRYALQREQNDPAGEQTLAQVNTMLMDSGGEVARILNGARADNDRIRQEVANRAGNFLQLVQDFKATPTLMMERLWGDVKEEVLASPNIEKYYISPSKEQKTILMINQDPDVIQALQRKKLEAARKTR